VAALERACRYRAFSLTAVERILAAQAQPKAPLLALAEEATASLTDVIGQDPVPPVRRPSTRRCSRLTMDRKTKSLRDRVLDHLAILRIPITAEELDHVLDVAEREGLATLEAIDRLLGEQAARRRPGPVIQQKIRVDPRPVIQQKIRVEPALKRRATSNSSTKPAFSRTPAPADPKSARMPRNHGGRSPVSHAVPTSANIRASIGSLPQSNRRESAPGSGARHSIWPTSSRLPISSSSTPQSFSVEISQADRAVLY
jgi:hypothetical protein